MSEPPPPVATEGATPTPPVSSAPTPPPVQETGGGLRDLLSKAKAKIQFRKAAKLEKIVAKAREKGSITNDGVQKLLRVSDATATRYLAELVRNGRLRASGRTSTTRYTPAQ